MMNANELLNDLKYKYNCYCSIPLGKSANSAGQKIQANKNLKNYVDNILVQATSGALSWSDLGDLESIVEQLNHDRVIANEILSAVRDEDLQYIRPIADNQRYKFPVSSLDDPDYLEAVSSVSNGQATIAEIGSVFASENHLSDDQARQLVFEIAKNSADDLECFSTYDNNSNDNDDGVFALGDVVLSPHGNGVVQKVAANGNIEVMHSPDDRLLKFSCVYAPDELTKVSRDYSNFVLAAMDDKNDVDNYKDGAGGLKVGDTVQLNDLGEKSTKGLVVSSDELDPKWVKVQWENGAASPVGHPISDLTVVSSRKFSALEVGKTYVTDDGHWTVVEKTANGYKVKDSYTGTTTEITDAQGENLKNEKNASRKIDKLSNSLHEDVNGHSLVIEKDEKHGDWWITSIDGRYLTDFDHFYLGRGSLPDESLYPVAVQHYTTQQIVSNNKKISEVMCSTCHAQVGTNVLSDVENLCDDCLEIQKERVE